MRLVAGLSVALAPFAAAAWSALHWDAVGAEGGVLWCIGFLACLALILVVAARMEGRLDG